MDMDLTNQDLLLINWSETGSYAARLPEKKKRMISLQSGCSTIHKKDQHFPQQCLLCYQKVRRK